MSRFRLVAALLTLLTLSLTVVEGVWASTCVPGMETGGAPAAATMHDGHMDMGAPSGSERAEDAGTETGSPTMPRCPLAPASGSCVALTVSLPAHVPDSFVPSPTGVLLLTAPVQSRDLLVASAFFRPPRP